MTDSKLYYTAPSDEAFEEMKQACLTVWEKYATSPEYLKEKTDRIKDIENIQDNFMFMFAMFDHFNQYEVVKILSEETKNALRERMVAGGNDNYYLIRIGL